MVRPVRERNPLKDQTKENTLSTFTPDLGDDLVITKMSLRPERQEFEEKFDESAESLISSAEILLREGLHAQAKKVARAALIKDPSLIQARKLLATIEEIELKELFAKEKSKRNSALKATAPSPWFSLEAAERERAALFNFLNIEEEKTVEIPPQEQEAFTRFLVDTYSSAPASSHVDLGIALAEMGLWTWAFDQMRSARRDSEWEVRATCLLGNLMVLANQPYDALIELEPLTVRGDLNDEEKLEAGYWIARAYEALAKMQPAIMWYESIHETKPDYRDVLERLSLCVRKLSSSSSSLS